MTNTYIARYNGEIEVRTTKTAWTHVTIYATPKKSEIIGSWHRSEKAALKGTSDAKILGWTIVKVIPVAPETDTAVIAAAKAEYAAALDAIQVERDAARAAKEAPVEVPAESPEVAETPSVVTVVYPESTRYAFLFYAGEEGRLVRNGRRWFVENEYGEVIGRHTTKRDAIRDFMAFMGNYGDYEVREEREFEGNRFFS